MNRAADRTTDRARRIVYDDLRGWIAEAERLGELRRVRGASWEEETGMAAALVGRRDDGPAVPFDDIPGIAPDLDKVALSEALAAAYPEASALIPPVEVAGGPVPAKVLVGDAVDLDIFPTPIRHEGDGGRGRRSPGWWIERRPWRR